MRYECPQLSTRDCSDTNELRASSREKRIDERLFRQHSALCTTPQFDNCPTYLESLNRIQRGIPTCQR